MHWKLRCALNTCKALVPFHQRLREWKRSKKYAGDEWNERSTIEQGLLQIEWIGMARRVDQATVLEVGTGWEPLIPILFSLAGAPRIYTCDVTRLCAISTLQQALASIRRHKALILEKLRLSDAAFEPALAVNFDSGLDKALDQLRITYLAPCDCRSVPLPDSTVDVVTSRAVLEHIPGEIIRGIYTDAFRLLRPGGLMCHIIDNSDHWQHVDKSISRVNFLRYPEWVFRWTCVNDLDYQNRLRHPEHVGLMTSTGFEIAREERDVDAGSLEALRTLPLDPRFAGFTHEDLAVLTSTLLVRKPDRVNAADTSVMAS
jgi:SAM-dependent methyltransferase